MSKRWKIGIVGGTFDPIHDAHLRLGYEAMEKIGLDKIVFMPTGNPYFKSGKRNITDAGHRSAMVKLAIQREDRFVFSDMEIRRHGETYTAETLRELSAAWPNVDFHFIMGADSLRDIDRWYKPEVIFGNAVVVVANRNHQVNDKRLESDMKFLYEKYAARIIPLEFESMDISSSDIRAQIQSGEWDNIPVPEQVLSYIRVHGLYGLSGNYRSEDISEKSVDTEVDFSGYTSLSEEEIHQKLRHSIKPSRYQHTLGVIETAVALARHWGTVSVTRAHLAALLHDCGKEAGDALSHASIGAELARKEYGISDEEILSAIASHTTGKQGMSELDKIIFIADYIEPGRNQAPGLENLRKKAYEDIDATLVHILRDTLTYLQNIGAEIDEQSIKTYNYYRNLTK